MSFSFIKKKQPTNTTNNVNMQYDFDSKTKNQDTFNGAPAQPAQSFNIPEPKLNPVNNNPPQPKKGFGFIKKKNLSNKAMNVNNLEQSNTSINSNDPKFAGTNNNNIITDLDSLINNTNELLNFGKVEKSNNFNNDNLSNSNNNLNINTLGDPSYQNIGNIEDDTEVNQGTPSNNSLPNYNFLNQEQNNNNMNTFLNNNLNEKEKEKPKEKKSGFSFLNKKPKKQNNNSNNNNTFNSLSNNDSNKNIPYIGNKTPLSSSMSDKVSEKSGNLNNNLTQGYSNINVITPIEKEKEESNLNYEMNNNYNEFENNNYNDMNNIDNQNDVPKPIVEETKPKELNEDLIKSKYNKKKNNFINDYIKYINELHSKKLSLQNQESELSLLNLQKENLIKEEQKAIDDNDYEKADHIENKIKQLKNNANEILSKIEEETHSLMDIKNKEIEINNNLLSDIDDVTIGYNSLKTKLEEKIDNFTNNELAKHEGENIRLEKLSEKLQFLKTNLEQDKNLISEEEIKINNLIKGQSAGIFENLENLNKDKSVLLGEIEEIKKKLAEKEKELDKLNLKIENKEKEINAIKSNFNYEFKKLNIKKKNYEDNLKDYEEQDIRYNNELKSFNEMDEKNKKYMDDLNKELKYLNDKINNNKNEYNEKKRDINKKELLLKEENDLHSKIFQSNKKINEINEKIELHHSKIQVLNVNNKIMQGEISQIEIKLPSLEEEKKSYIIIKNFKEAGRVSKELKESIEKKNQNINKIEKNKKEIEKFESELKKYQNDIENLEKENQQFEKDLDISKYKNLVDSLNTMNNFYNKEKNGKISDEIKLTKNQIDKLKIKEHVIQYIKDNNTNNTEEVKANNSIDDNKKNEGFSSNLFSGLNMNTDFNNNTYNALSDTNKNEEENGEYIGFNLMTDDNDENKNENNEDKIKELTEKIQNAVNVS